uniref:Uncharacterized protein n=1 Tax=Anguilla anguilla TaxID=7936 RepID=A0A0E9VIQ7_ANGAN
MAFMEDESSGSGRVGRTRMESYFFSCELSSQVPFYTFRGDEDENVEHYWISGRSVWELEQKKRAT